MNKLLTQTPGPIGVFDSGYGGLTILKAIRELLILAIMLVRHTVHVRSILYINSPVRLY